MWNHDELNQLKKVRELFVKFVLNHPVFKQLSSRFEVFLSLAGFHFVFYEGGLHGTFQPSKPPLDFQFSYPIGKFFSADHICLLHYGGS